MNCRELREYLFAFLDSELDAALSMEVQRHLEQCPECAREAEIERAIRRQLANALHESNKEQTQASDQQLDEVFSRVASGDKPRLKSAPLRWRWVSALSAAAVIGLVVVVGFLWRGTGAVHHPSQFVDLLIADFEHFQAKGRPLQIASSDPTVVSNWVAEQTAFNITLPALGEAHGKLLGARKCTIDGKPAALAAYDFNGALASLVVMPGTYPDIDSMERIEQDGHTHWVDRCKGHTVLACKRGALVYAAVSTLPEDRLLALMTNPER
jgi:anti-sigma factor RsiW